LVRHLGAVCNNRKKQRELSVNRSWLILDRHLKCRLASHRGGREIAIVRQRGLDEAYARHPERFSKGRPIVKMPPDEVSINPVPADADIRLLS